MVARWRLCLTTSYPSGQLVLIRGDASFGVYVVPNGLLAIHYRGDTLLAVLPFGVHLFDFFFEILDLDRQDSDTCFTTSDAIRQFVAEFFQIMLLICQVVQNILSIDPVFFASNTDWFFSSDTLIVLVCPTAIDTFP
jgi:hypothetical protein